MSAYTYNKEYGKVCGLCRKRRTSRQYHELINGKWLKLCAECWNKQSNS